MNQLIISRLNKLYERYKEIKILINNPKTIQTKNKLYNLSKEYNKLTNIINKFEKWLKIKKDIQITKNILQDPELYDIAYEELTELNKNIKKLEQELKILLIPQDKNDNRGCFLEIRAGTGGNEAALFASVLFRMYNRFIEIKNWKLKIISMSTNEQGGYKEIISKIPNQGAYNQLKFESGGHRVQRIPETEHHGRIHTSTCTVAVMPEIPIQEMPTINENELRIDTFRSSGAGGQHVNTTDSAIRITHIPSGIVVECQDERSQHKNKSKALSVLAARLYTAEINKRQKNESSTRRNLLGTGDRSDRIRTYNFPQGRVTDHRINLTLYKLDKIIEGNLDSIIQILIKEHQIDQINKLSEIII